MILNLMELAGILLGGLLTIAAFGVNIYALIRGRRVFRGPRSCRLKML